MRTFLAVVASLLVLAVISVRDTAFSQDKLNCFKPLPPRDVIAACDQTIASDPRQAQAYQARGVAWYRMGDYDHAIADFSQSIAIDADYIRAFYNRGLAWEKKGNLDNALTDFKYIADADPSFPDAQIAVARVSALKRKIALAATTPKQQQSNHSWDGWHKVPDPSRIQYKVYHDKVVALSNLSAGCNPGSAAPFEGKIAKVKFDEQGVNVASFVLEDNDGARSLINVDSLSISDPGMNMADLGWIEQGLQTLLHPNWYVQGSAFWCGAAERVAVLDAIQPKSQPSWMSTVSSNPGRQTSSNDAEGIPLSVEGGNVFIPVQINGQITLNFVIDSGASDVSIPADVVSTLMRTGTIQKSDFLGQATFTLADGSTVPSAIFVIRSLKVGNHLLENVRGSVASAKADLLLGQSFLSRFNSWSIDNKRQVLLLN